MYVYVKIDEEDVEGWTDIHTSTSTSASTNLHTYTPHAHAQAKYLATALGWLLLARVASSQQFGIGASKGGGNGVAGAAAAPAASYDSEWGNGIGRDVT